MSTVEILTPQNFFRDQVCQAARALKLKLDDDVEFYLVNLLCDFINPAQLDIDSNMPVLDTPLALMFKKAQESNPGTQIKVLKRLGDTSLYLAGYFQDYFNRKTYDAGYYISMGSAAYEHASVLLRSQAHGSHFSKVYSNLSADFDKLVNIITEISESTPLTQNKDLLSTYNRWQQNQSEKLRKILSDEGILPLSLTTKDAQ